MITKGNENATVMSYDIRDLIEQIDGEKSITTKSSLAQCLREELGLDYWGVTIKIEVVGKEWHANPKRTSMLISKLVQGDNDAKEQLLKQLGAYIFPKRRYTSWQNWDWQEASQHPATWRTFGDQ